MKYFNTKILIQISLLFTEFIYTTTNEFRACIMSWTSTEGTGQWTSRQSKISTWMSRRCSWMLWTSPSSRSLTSLNMWEWLLRYTIMCRSSKICHACCGTECLFMWSQLWATAIHSGKFLVNINFHLIALSTFQFFFRRCLMSLKVFMTKNII